MANWDLQDHPALGTENDESLVRAIRNDDPGLIAALLRG
jgi:hypothetical protein